MSRLAVGQLLVLSAVVLTPVFVDESEGQELPPEIQVDRLLVQAERETADGDHWSAVFTFERILELCEEHQLEIPVEFWFRQAGVFHGAGLHERAVEAATRYLRDGGQEGEHYSAALKILDAAEVALSERKRAEARVRAAAARAEREAAARASAIASALPEMVRISHWEQVFELSKYEVTFAQWDVCTEYGPCRWVPDEGWGREERPVVNVSWHDAKSFTGWLVRETGETYRLPSSFEWTTAARAGSQSRYSWGRRIGHNQANCDGCGSEWDSRSTAPVGSFAANALGLHDMHGNVWEWVENCWVRSDWVWNDLWAVGAELPKGARCVGRVKRGGSFISKPRSLRIYPIETWNRADETFRNTGFRVARTIEP